ncbi:bifunctional 4-hydroxy-2-oxoglutarate aldolase/2-dehydro-3-deoxy-phosphogluconate aldolase [Flammeovirga agarivorans]|uniref:Bifunctional 4-hydroxy-2-oxoglutarate aldolase/2-dehydro-3-deoxy-phosphogluconate aldolase n=1 Tax=Flammeovirga agarivorans TaxID=2726742 RepID=A0A7X8SNL3_9BACT|nr:bifunctional 4-hydroxy-2-oxoglutarate aldolase/2-dehydro-3-deoxy-phosphogluconate aldolase [Flammeovirga agarivorans]NLR93427.1 bifunctional 4-hydroxy-2-oxoglutarate aldolase/2-dehydro-3-deoxy-phosphogluconate aldolase [Flammeovirga agarivorans]
MYSTSFSQEKFQQAPVVGILRGIDKETLDRIIPVYIRAGFSTIEITMNTDEATSLIRYLSQSYPDLNVGAGTVCSLEDLDNALKSGAQFIVTPIIDETIIKKCKKQKIPVFPGALTPSEIYRAWEAGATAVKVFPCSQFGIQYIKDVMAPLDQIKLLPTGGVTKDNITNFFKVGVEGVGMGSSLFPKKLMNEGQEEALALHLKEIKTAYEAALQLA